MVDVASYPNHHLLSGPSSNSASTTQVDNNEKFKPMKSEQNRLQSYINWPHRAFLEPKDLAKEGFFYTQKQDIVKCAFCGLELGKWEHGDVPSQDHRAWSSMCPLVRDLPCGNIPMTENNSGSSSNGITTDATSFDTCGKYGINIRPNSIPENGPRSYDINQYAIKANTSYPQYATYESRLRTYNDWPVSMKQKPAELADAGFYYSGKSDQTICFSCGGGLKSWEEADIPWEQHATWFSKCPYLRLHKTQEYIESHNLSDDGKLNKSVPKPSTSSPAKEVNCLNSTVAATSTTTSEPIDATSGEPISIGSTSTTSTTTPTASVESESTGQTLCKICYSKEVGVVFLPCGHMIACVDCAPALTKCGVCRRELEATVRAFLS